MNIKNKKQYLIFALAGLLMMGSIVFAYSTKNNTSNNIQQSTTASNDVFEGFTNGSEVRVSYTDLSNDNIFEEKVVIEDKTQFLEARHSVGLLKQKPTYQVDYQIIDLDLSYVDVALTINKISGNVKTAISGLKPKQKIGLSIDNAFYESNVSADWSGKIVFDHHVYNMTAHKKICIAIRENKEICHHTGNSEVIS